MKWSNFRGHTQPSCVCPLCVTDISGHIVAAIDISRRKLTQTAAYHSGIKTTEKCSFEASTFFEIFSNKVRSEEFYSKNHCFYTPANIYKLNLLVIYLQD